MKAIIITVLSILLAIIIVIGNIHWRNIQTEFSINSTNTSYRLEKAIDLEYYSTFATAWSEDAQRQLKNAIKNEGTYHIVLLGSLSIGNSDLGLFPYIKEKLLNTYDKYVTIESIVYDETSSDYVLGRETKDLIDSKPDMIIFEPFLLADNNVVDIHTTLANISSIIKATKEELPNVTFILQPPNQIYNASLYPTQVASLKEYAESEKITYLDHWVNWPEGDSIEVLDYLNENGTPNKKGYEIWSDYITDFLVTK